MGTRQGAGQHGADSHRSHEDERLCCAESKRGECRPWAEPDQAPADSEERRAGEQRRAAEAQLGRISLTSRAFHNDLFGPFCEQLAELCGMDMVLAMNSGAEGVETAEERLAG